MNEDGKIGDKLSLNGPQAGKFTRTHYLLIYNAKWKRRKNVSVSYSTANIQLSWIQLHSVFPLAPERRQLETGHGQWEAIYMPVSKAAQHFNRCIYGETIDSRRLDFVQETHQQLPTSAASSTREIEKHRWWDNQREPITVALHRRLAMTLRTRLAKVLGSNWMTTRFNLFPMFFFDEFSVNPEMKENQFLAQQSMMMTAIWISFCQTKKKNESVEAAIGTMKDVSHSIKCRCFLELKPKKKNQTKR